MIFKITELIKIVQAENVSGILIQYYLLSRLPQLQKLSQCENYRIRRY